ncbi:MAG: ASCH domain-containing protein [gamma proteobacterium symbiont of Clathrolucina costata]
MIILPKRALIVRKNWLDLIFEGIKPWEMRSCKTNVRGYIGLIAAGSGHITGTAALTDSLEAFTPNQFWQFTDKHQISAQGNESIAEKWNYPWVLENATRFTTPVPYQHPRGAVIWVNL